MRHKIILSLIMVLCCSFTLTDTPAQFQKALTALYPKVQNADWSQSWNFYVATFNNNNFETKVWMNNQAEWVMTDVNLQTTDELPSNVYTAFMFSEYSQWNVLDVYEIEFPQFNNQYILTVNMDNSSTTYQMFYSPSGKLLNVRNVSYESHAITPLIYGFQN